MTMFGDARLPQRFWDKVQISDTGCWEWTAALSHGYASFRIGSTLDGTRRQVHAHRYLWVTLVGPIARTLVVDHLCKNTRCVNPEHLEPVPEFVNVVVRSNSPSGRNHRKTHCDSGHEFTPENTYIAPSQPRSRLCRACRQRREDKRSPRSRRVAGRAA